MQDYSQHLQKPYIPLLERGAGEGPCLRPRLGKCEKIRDQNTRSHQWHRATYSRFSHYELDWGRNSSRCRSGKGEFRGCYFSPEQDYPSTRSNFGHQDTFPTSLRWRWHLLAMCQASRYG